MNQAEMSSTTLTSVGLVAPNDPRLSGHFMRPLASSSPRATVRLTPHPSSNGVLGGHGEPPAKSAKIQQQQQQTQAAPKETQAPSAADNDVEFIEHLVAPSGGSPKKAASSPSKANPAAAASQRSSLASAQVTTAAQAALAAQQNGATSRPTIRMKSRPKKNAASAPAATSEPTSTNNKPSPVESAVVESVAVKAESSAVSGSLKAATTVNLKEAPVEPPANASHSTAAAAAAAAAPANAAAATGSVTPQKTQQQQQRQEPPQQPVVASSLSNNNNNISSTSNGPTNVETPTTASATTTTNNKNNTSNTSNTNNISSTPTRTPTQMAPNANHANMAAPQPFDWAKYLELHPAPVAPNEAFMQHHEPLENKFEIKMKLIAKDPRNSSSWCLAWVVNVLGLRVRLRFDGSDSMNDFFELIDSENIRPYGSSPDQLLYPPVAYKGNLSTYPKFVEKQLLKPDVRLAPKEIFVTTPRKPARNLFQEGMKLEAIDRKNAFLICPATVGEVQGDDIKILFDGWRGSFDYTCKYYSRDIFPVNWCSRTYHPIAPPNNWNTLLLGNGDSTGSSKKNSPNKTTNNHKTSPNLAKENHNKTTPQSNHHHTKPSQHQPSHHKQTPVQPQPPPTPPQSNSKPSSVKQQQQQQHPSQHQLLDLEDLPKFSCQRAVPYCEWLKTKQSLSQITDEDDSFTVSESTSFASTFASNIAPPQDQETSVNNPPSTHPELSSSATSTQSTPEREIRPTRGRPSKKMKLERQLREQQQQQKLSNESSSQPQAPPTPPLPPPSSTPTIRKEPTTNFYQMKPDSACRGCSGFVSSVEDVVDLIESDESLAKYSRIFQQHEIDGKAFCLLTTDIMINHLGLKIGPVLKINSLIEQVKCHHRRTPSNINQSL